MNQFIDIQQDMEGYFRCTVGGARGRDRIHRFVAEAFVKNDDPEHKKQVDHIDGNKENNRADNLRWVTIRENIQAAGKKGVLRNCGINQPCIGIKIDGDGTVKLFKSQHEASEFIGGCKRGSEVNKVLNNKRYTTHGWLFRRLSAESIDNIKEFVSKLQEEGK